MIHRRILMGVARGQETDSRCMNPRYGHRGKRLGAKRVRTMLKLELENQLKLIMGLDAVVNLSEGHPNAYDHNTPR